MKKAFAHYYRLTDSEFKELWGACVFSFDANFLLDLYRFQPDTQKKVIEILRNLKNHIWLSHQAALEFHRNRITVIGDVWKPYRDLQTFVSSQHEAALTKLSGIPTKHPFIRVDDIQKVFEDAKQKLMTTLDVSAAKHPNLLDDLGKDDVLKEVTELFEGRVGGAYSESDLQTLYTDGANRYSNRVPPGFRDTSKDGNDKFGDLVLWKQLMDFARNKKVSLVFVTGDHKEDWWSVSQGRTTGPLPALREEFQLNTGQGFYMYQTEAFLRQAETYTDVKVKKEVIDEVKKVAADRRLDVFKKLTAPVTPNFPSVTFSTAPLRRRRRSVLPSNLNAPHGVVNWDKFLTDYLNQPSANDKSEVSSDEPEEEE